MSHGRTSHRSVWLIAIATVAAWVIASPLVGLAEQGGTIRGAVVDRLGNVVADATVVMNAFGSVDDIEVATSSNGRYQSQELLAGLYTVTALKGDLGGETFRVRIRDGQTVEVNFMLEPGQRVATWLTEAGERESFARAFAAGVEASRADRYEDAVDAFRLALTLNPTCLECNFNLAVTLVELDRLDEAEASFRTVLDIRPDYAAAYYGLSNLYTLQNRSDDAAEARSQANRLALERLAAGRARSEDAVASGVAFLNAGNTADAVGRFEAAIQMDSGFAPARYWLAVGLIELGRTEQASSELEHYLQLQPAGEFADEARAHLSNLR